jgi:antitoxin MazE
MNLQINRWGNSLALRLPAALVKNLGVQEGSSVSTRELGERLLALEDAPQAADALQARRHLLAELEVLQRGMPVTQPVSKEELSRY